MIKATVITDASFSFTDRKIGIGGWAAWVKVDDVPGTIKGYGTIKQKISDNTVAEIYAAINGIWLARKHGAEEILVRTDCQAVQGLIKGTMKSDRLIKIWKNGYLDRPEFSGIELRGRHVKGHGQITDAASWVNDWCDKHAKLGRRCGLKGDKCLNIISPS